MLLDRVSTTQSFSDLDASEDSYALVTSGADRARWPAVGPQPRTVDQIERSDAIAEGDQVVFARLDVAEALGIWRHALGRVVETHAEPHASVTLDVKFEGHETLHRYLSDLFEKRAN